MRVRRNCVQWAALATLAATVSAGGMARAAIIGSVLQVPVSPAAVAADPQLAGAIVLDVFATLVNGDRFNVAAIYAEPVGQASFYQHPLGGVQEPSAGAVSLFPALGFDTFLAVPVGATFSAGGGFINPVPRFDEQRLDIVWSAQSAVGPTSGTHRVARVTILDGIATGYVDLRSALLPGVSVIVPLDNAIPEPAAVGTFLGLSLVCGRRIRRS